MQNYQDEIDIKRFFGIVTRSKKTVFIVTLITTITSGIYAYVKTPIYEATALVQIGSYKLEDGRVVTVENESSLAKKLYTRHVVVENFDKNNLHPKITSIIVPKKIQGFIEVTAEATSNELAINEINRGIDLFKSEHDDAIEEHRAKLLLDLTTVDKQLESLQSTELELLEEWIKEREDLLAALALDNKSLQKSISQVEANNPVLALVKHGNKLELSSNMLKIKNSLEQLQSDRVDMKTTQLYELLQKKKKTELLLNPYSLKKTRIVGGVVVNNYPIRPKKVLVIFFGFFLGLIFSIFMIFTKKLIKEE